jgi:hypothetical protein
MMIYFCKSHCQIYVTVTLTLTLPQQQAVFYGAITLLGKGI